MRLPGRALTLLAAMIFTTFGFAQPQSADTKLAACRKQIDDTDQQIVRLLNQRAKLVAEVGQIKREAHLPIAAPSREQQVLRHIVEMGSAGPLPPEALTNIYRTVIYEMRTWEESLGTQKSPAGAHR